jgi:hypothetical protein
LVRTLEGYPAKLRVLRNSQQFDENVCGFDVLTHRRRSFSALVEAERLTGLRLGIFEEVFSTAQRSSTCPGVTHQ